MSEETSEQRRIKIVAEIHEKNRQDLIAFSESMHKALRARTLEGAKKAIEKALRKAGYL